MGFDNLRESALELQRTLVREQDARNEAEALLYCLDAVQLAKDSRAAFQLAMDFILEYIQCDEGVLHLFGEQEGLIVLAATSPQIAALPWRKSELPQRALAGHPMRLFDLKRSTSFGLVRDQMGLASGLCIPLEHQNQKTLLSFFSSKKSFFSPEHLRLMKRLGTLVGHAHGRLDNERLKIESIAAAARAREAEVSNRIKGEFIANMSHELRTPLNGIIANLELAMLEDLSPASLPCLETAQYSANNLYRLVNDILDLSHSENNEMVLAREEFDLRECLNFAINSLADNARKKGLHLGLEIDSALPQRLRGDKHRLSQLVMNLIDNSIKFSDEGAIKVTCSDYRSDTGIPTLQIIVADTGIGIHQDDLTRIFDKFEQVDRTIAKRNDGGGLGLAVVKRILGALGGSVHVESEVGAGSRFQLDLPIVPVDVLTPTALEPAYGEAELTTMDVEARILLVEDNPINQAVTLRILQKLGHHAELAKDGLQAVNILKDQNFDIILMDIHMPVMDGLQATREIRSLSTTAASSIIVALTASAMVGSREKCLEAGMNEYLSKPVRIKELKNMIDKCLVPVA